MQIGFPVDYTSLIVQTGSVVGDTRITAYWNEMPSSDGTVQRVGYNEDHVLIRALKELDPSLSISLSPGNEYVRDQGPRIEIILGEDAENYFPTIKPAKYLPVKNTPAPKASDTPALNTSPSSLSTPSKQESTKEQTSTPPSQSATNTPDAQTELTPLPPPVLPSETPPNKEAHYQFQAGEWEQF